MPVASGRRVVVVVVVVALARQVASRNGRRRASLFSEKCVEISIPLIAPICCHHFLTDHPRTAFHPTPGMVGVVITTTAT